MSPLLGEPESVSTCNVEGCYTPLVLYLGNEGPWITCPRCQYVEPI